MKILFLLLALLLQPRAQAFEIFNLNVFDQLQGEWPANFRAKRLGAVADYVKSRKPDLVVFQEASAKNAASKDSVDGAPFKKLYPHRLYVHEMMGKDNLSYGYWMGAKKKPDQWIEDGFSFPGGVPRRVQGAFFKNIGGGQCLGVLSLHLSYQTSAVRVEEAHWLLGWLKAKETICPQWLVLGDFNADRPDAEMKVLFDGGLQPLYQGKDFKPTIGAFNPIRRIYGEKIESKTIDWALGWNLAGEASVVLDQPHKGEWVSDHAAVYVKLNPAAKK